MAGTAEAPKTGNDLLSMSDDDFAQLNSAPANVPVVEKTQAELDAAAQAETDRLAAEAAEKEKTEKVDPPVEEDTRTEAEKAADAVEEDDLTDEEKAAAEAAKAKPLVDPKAKPSPEATAAAAKTEKEKAAAASLVPGEGGTATAPDYKAFHDQVMKPFKANGKTIELKSVDEAIQLMQMGANYTRKLQELQPSKKLLMMLENNGLLDEAKISYLIDLDKKNPDAVKKLVKDSGLNPIDIDVDAETTYQAGNHRVTDDAVNFKSILDELSSDPEGTKTLQVINTDWDQTSKEVLWGQPGLMPIIHQARESGVYDLIVTEINRQKTLGKIPPNTPFVYAYKAVGEELSKSGAFGEGTTAPKTPVATTVAKPKSALANGAQASAASPTRSSPRTAKIVTNPLAMSDDDFLKQMNGRL